MNKKIKCSPTITEETNEAVASKINQQENGCFNKAKKNNAVIVSVKNLEEQSDQVDEVTVLFVKVIFVSCDFSFNYRN